MLLCKSPSSLDIYVKVLSMICVPKLDIKSPHLPAFFSNFPTDVRHSTIEMEAFVVFESIYNS